MRPKVCVPVMATGGLDKMHLSEEVGVCILEKELEHCVAITASAPAFDCGSSF